MSMSESSFICIGIAVVFGTITLIVGAVSMSKGAYPQRHEMNGFHCETGFVTDGRYYLSQSHRSDARRLRDVTMVNFLIHYQFGGTVNVTDSVVNGTSKSHFDFEGGHNCRYLLEFDLTAIKGESPQSWIEKNYPRGMRKRICYKPPNYADCSLFFDVNYNYRVGVTLLTMFGAFICVPIVCLLAHSVAPDQNPLVPIGLLVFSPIILPLVLIYYMLEACGCFYRPPEHPITQYEENVKSNVVYVSEKFTNGANAISTKMGMSSKERTEREKEPEVDDHADVDVEAMQVSVDPDQAPSTLTTSGQGYVEVDTLASYPPGDEEVDEKVVVSSPSAQPEITVLPEEPNYSQDQTLIGHKVEARKSGGDEFSATITGVHYDGSFDVEFDNGDKEMFVPRSSLKLV